VSLIKYGLENMLCWSWQEAIYRLVSTPGKILSSVQPSYTKILTLLITYTTEIRRTFCTLEKFITWITFIPNCDIACLVYVKLKLIGKYLPFCSKPEIVQYLYLIINCMIVCFIHFHDVHSFFLAYVRPFFGVRSFRTTQLHFWPPL